jgi:hypothetical protein
VEDELDWKCFTYLIAALRREEMNNAADDKRTGDKLRQARYSIACVERPKVDRFGWNVRRFCNMCIF